MSPQTRVTCPPCNLSGPPQVNDQAARELSRIHDRLLHAGQPNALVTR